MNRNWNAYRRNKVVEGNGSRNGNGILDTNNSNNKNSKHPLKIARFLKWNLSKFYCWSWLVDYDDDLAFFFLLSFHFGIYYLLFGALLD